MEIIRTKAYDLDLGQFDTEMLLLMAQSGSRLAENELIERFYGQVKKQIDGLARGKRLLAEDVADAEQNAVFAIDEAIRNYNLHQPEDGRKCSFASYLDTVVEARFVDYWKHLWRKGKRFDTSPAMERPYDRCSPAASRASNLSLKEKHVCTSALEDPARLVEEHEFWEQWNRAVEQLSPWSRQVYEATVAGKPLDELAQELHTSRRTLKRTKKRLIQELKANRRR
jgi:RNA polymerase sigma factor (sigma-70 family)